MRFSSAVLTAFFLSATASVAQTGFTTKTYPAADETVLRVADFNHDGKPDLLGYNPNFNTGDVYLNDGSGGFGAPVALQGMGYIQVAKIGDMNGDGAPDIVACDIEQSRNGSFAYLLIYLNDGKGNFTATQTTALTYGCQSLVVADVNGDGHLDVVVAANGQPSATANNVFQTFFGDGSGDVGSPVTQQNVDLDSPDSSNSFTNCGVVDMNSGNFYVDGKVSLMVNTQCLPTGQNNPGYLGTTFVGHGNGTGNFTFTFSHKGHEYLTDGHTVDVNEDGKPDATFYSVEGQPFSNLYYVQNMGGGSFTYNQLTNDIEAGGETPISFTGDTTADFTGDGINDIAALYTTAAPNSSSNDVKPYISILAGSKSGTFAESQHWLVDPNATGTGDLTSADFNGDGKPDLVAVVLDGAYPNQTASLYVYTNTQGSSASCSAPTAANTNVICSPAKGATTTSPVTVTAASNVSGFTLNRLYLDNTSVYQTTSQTVNTPITAANGTHDLVLVSYDNTGQAFTYSTTFTVGSGGCLPSSAGVKVCQPASGATTSSPVTFTAGAQAQAGDITALRFYVDNVAVYTANNPGKTTTFQATGSAAVSAGTHQLVTVGYESTGAALTTSESFTVEANANCYPASAGAMICSPAKGATESSPVQVNAGATAGSGYITAIALYIDNVRVSLQDDPTAAKSWAETVSVSAKAGSHNLVVVGYESTGGAVTASETLTIH